MGLFRAVERRAVTNLSPRAQWETDYPSLFGAATNSGRRVDQDSALRMLAVWTCVSLIADSISTLPVETYTVTPKGETKRVDDPSWVRSPNPFQTPQAFWHRVVASLLLDGNAFIATVRNDRAHVVSAFVLDPRLVYIHEGKAGDDVYQYAGETFDQSQILHIPGFTTGGKSRGLSPVDAAREAIGLGLTAEEFGGRFFNQGTTMAGVIQHPGNPKPDEAKLLRQMFKKNHAGLKNSHAVGILTGGASWQSITITPEQAQFLDTRRFQKTEIAQMYRVPAYMVDPSVTSTWGTGIEEQNKWFVDVTLMPHIVRIEQAVSRKLLAGRLFIKFNLDERLRPKTKERFETWGLAVEKGIMSRDEVRAKEGLPPLPDGKGAIFYAPLNTAPVGTPPKVTKSSAASADPDVEDAERNVTVNVNVEPADVRVEPSVVNVSPRIAMPRRSTRIERDERGEIVRTVEEEA